MINPCNFMINLINHLVNCDYITFIYILYKISCPFIWNLKSKAWNLRPCLLFLAFYDHAEEIKLKNSHFWFITLTICFQADAKATLTYFYRTFGARDSNYSINLDFLYFFLILFLDITKDNVKGHCVA
jgi:hypothetical protein